MSIIKFIIWLALVCCVLYVVVHQFLLNIPAEAKWIYNLGMLFQGLSLSYIAAFIFYVVHNHLPQESIKRKYQPIIERELGDLWEVCNGFTRMMESYSGVSVDMDKSNYKESIKIQLKALKVNPREYGEETIVSESNIRGKSYTIPPDEEFDKKFKPLHIREMQFEKWSEAIEYVASNISITLNKILKMKEVVSEDTIFKIFDLEKSINDFKMVAKIYEESSNSTFENGYLENNFAKFYEGTKELQQYKKRS